MGLKRGRTAAEQDTAKLDEMWLSTMLLLLGEQFDGADNEQVTGAVMSSRAKADRISLWTNTASDAKACTRLGQRFKEALKAAPTEQIGFQPHVKAIRRGSSDGAGADMYTV